MIAKKPEAAPVVPPLPDDRINTEGAARLLRVSHTTLHRYLRLGRLPYWRIGQGYIVLSKRDVLALVTYTPAVGS